MSRSDTSALREDDRGREALLRAALDAAKSVQGAARLLGISNATAWRWLKEFAIVPPRARRLVP